MLGQITSMAEDRSGVYVQLESQSKFKLNEIIDISRKKVKRDKKLNALYWCYLEWCINPKGGNLESLQGRLTSDSLHYDSKAFMSYKFQMTYKPDFSTAEMDNKEFGNYMELMRQEFILGYLGIEDSRFWDDYDKYKEWQEYHPEGTFKQFMEGQ